jgi:RNA polymerase sigma factor (sigma-70 family)
MVIEQYSSLVASIAYEFSRKFRMVETNDIRQQLWVWFLEHPNKVKTWESFDGKQNVKLIAKSLRNAAKDYCQKEKAQIVGYRVEDNYYYDKELIETLLPAVIRGDLVAPAINEMGYSSTKKVASEGGNWFAMVGDIERALSKLNNEQYYIVCLKYEEGFENLLIASELGISEDAVRMRLNRALGNLTNFLGGSRPNREKDYAESTPNDNQNG